MANSTSLFSMEYKPSLDYNSLIIIAGVFLLKFGIGMLLSWRRKRNNNYSFERSFYENLDKATMDAKELLAPAIVRSIDETDTNSESTELTRFDVNTEDVLERNTNIAMLAFLRTLCEKKGYASVKVLTQVKDVQGRSTRPTILINKAYNASRINPA